jgi:phenylpropionate dioxygenase-like ring-hydroxylating dioxygenase large terminal subunit
MKGITYALPDDRPEMQRARQLNQDINMHVQDEDTQLIEWVDEGMRSRAFDGLMLSDREVGVAAFHNRLREVLPVLTLEQAPPAGTLAEVNAEMLAKRQMSAVG